MATQELKNFFYYANGKEFTEDKFDLFMSSCVYFDLNYFFDLLNEEITLYNT